jgi:hypothetical protein
MAYPCGGPNCDNRVAHIIKEKTGVRYARTVSVTESFEPFRYLYQYQGTLYHHGNWNLLFKKGKEFFKAQNGYPKSILHMGTCL